MSDDVDPRFGEYRRHRDRRLRNELIEDHRRVADRVARRYRSRGVSDDDLEQVALLGLLTALERFDPDRGVPFGGFASIVVEGEVRKFFRDQTWSMTVPRRTKELWLTVRRVGDELTTALGRSPTIGEIAETAGLAFDEVVVGLDADRAYRSDSLELSTVSGRAVGDRDPEIELDAEIADLLDRLPEREARIVRLRFFGDRSQQQIADELGISQMHVSRLLRRALQRMRDAQHD